MFKIHTIKKIAMQKGMKPRNPTPLGTPVPVEAS